MMNRQQRRAAGKSSRKSKEPQPARLADQARGALARNDPQAAIAPLRSLVAIAPAFPGAVLALATALKEVGELDEAVALMEGEAPRDIRAQFNLGLIKLALGQFEEGWEHYEARLKIPGFDVHTGFPQPFWDGGDLSGMTLLVHAEQGLGDVIQFARYLPLLKGRAKRVLFAVPASLRTLFKDLAGVDELLTGEGAPPHFDCHCPLLSLPRLFRTRLDSIPADLPYLRADGTRVSDMGRRFPWLKEPGPKVGLVWAGRARPNNPDAMRMDGRRSLRLADLASLAKCPSVRLVSLQEGPAALQAQSPPDGMVLLDPMPQVGDFADTAAIIAHLDLVVSVDTAVAHLAGALGKPVWILSRFDACWRWLKDRDDSPWYPDARLFRQTRPGEWPPTIRRLSGEMEKWAGERVR